MGHKNFGVIKNRWSTFFAFLRLNQNEIALQTKLENFPLIWAIFPERLGSGFSEKIFSRERIS